MIIKGKKMNDEELQKIAQNLAQLLLDSQKNQYEISFNIDKSNESVVVFVVKTAKKDLFVGQLERIVKAVSGPYGQPCPKCNGTGKIT